MWVGTRLTCTKFTLLSRSSATIWATDNFHLFEGRLLPLHSLAIRHSEEEKWSILPNELR
jgi:hypothetical protein